ncbi:MAG TPA: hypothetical protein VM367_08515 [Pseudonocardia sp.]|jgi:hypothetical protein|nr:hypothetical protein [Pseudonocardia sp.]
MSATGSDLEDAGRRELSELARRRGVAGRSSMSRDELVDALRSEDEPVADSPRPSASRFEAFHELARERARGGMVLLPRVLDGNDRRMHVRQTIREDHHLRITQGNEEA